MNGQEYENGYFRGHTTTPDERAGARAAAADRFEKENAEAWKRHADETALRAEEDARRVQQMQADAYEQKRREELALAQKKKRCNMRSNQENQLQMTASGAQAQRF